MKDSSANQAVSIDLGASSLRFALGEFSGDKIDFRVIEQIPNEALESEGRLIWDIDSILSFCERAADFAAYQGPGCSIGIDSWGVDHGLIGEDGKLLQPVVCYRDRSHVEWYEKLSSNRHRLFEITGIQHQPFNTIYQLAARSAEDPSLPSKTRSILILPDLLNYLLTGSEGWELTQCSTTQLLGLDGKWSQEAFGMIGWPCKMGTPQLSGRVVGTTALGVDVMSVGSHDTASGVCGLGSLRRDQAFLNIGTWMLFGCMLDHPDASVEAEAANFTNERAVDGRIRFLSNIPGFYILNRLHSEMEIDRSIPEWLGNFDPDFDGVADVFDSAFYNPDSMVECMRSHANCLIENECQMASLGLNSLVAALSHQVSKLQSLTGICIQELRVSGGGSGSSVLCQALADKIKIAVIAGPQEATLLGNLGIQFLAKQLIPSQTHLAETIDRSATLKRYEPTGVS